jgi:hypothetical protein
LQSFLKKIYYSTNKDGKLWLEGHKLHPEGELFRRFSNIELEDEDLKRAVSLFFGGCGNDPLYETIGLNHRGLDRANSIIITPPYFVSETSSDNKENNCQKYLKGILYDLKNENNKEWKSSHAKVYLIKIDNEYSFLFGSANCTPSGVGWNFDKDNSREIASQSVECLVKYSLKPKEFNKLKEKIENYYEPFLGELINECGSLIPVNDFWGEIFSKYGKVTSVIYDTNDNTNNNKINSNTMLKAIKYSIDIKVDDGLKTKIENKIEESKKNEDDVKIRFYPAEYSKTCYATLKFEEKNNQTLKVELIYKQHDSKNNEKEFKFQKCQQMLVIGNSNAVLPFDGLLVCNIPKPEGVCDSLNDIFLSKAIKDYGDLAESKKYLEQEIKRISNANLDNYGMDKKTLVEELKCLKKIFE